MIGPALMLPSTRVTRSSSSGAREMTVDEAVRRVDAIAPLLLSDVRKLLDGRQVMEVANGLVQEGAGKGDRAVEGVLAFNIVQQSLALSIAFDVARVFDVTANRALDDQDKASLPVLVHHLRKQAVQERLVERARGWVELIADENAEACRAALAQALDAFGAGAESAQGLAAQERIRELRTLRLAHNLFDREPDQLPNYGDLFRLADAAREVVEPAWFAITGGRAELPHREAWVQRAAVPFWTRALQPPNEP